MRRHLPTVRHLEGKQRPPRGRLQMKQLGLDLTSADGSQHLRLNRASSCRDVGCSQRVCHRLTIGCHLTLLRLYSGSALAPGRHYQRASLGIQ
jgi:hypothetical protein